MRSSDFDKKFAIERARRRIYEALEASGNDYSDHRVISASNWFDRLIVQQMRSRMDESAGFIRIKFNGISIGDMDSMTGLVKRGLKQQEIY